MPRFWRAGVVIVRVTLGRIVVLRVVVLRVVVPRGVVRLALLVVRLGQHRIGIEEGGARPQRAAEDDGKHDRRRLRHHGNRSRRLGYRRAAVERQEGEHDGRVGAVAFLAQHWRATGGDVQPIERGGEGRDVRVAEHRDAGGWPPVGRRSAEVGVDERGGLGAVAAGARIGAGYGAAVQRHHHEQQVGAEDAAEQGARGGRVGRVERIEQIDHTSTVATEGAAEQIAERGPSLGDEAGDRGDER